MDEDEAALLAELRAISAGAAGTSRFDDKDTAEGNDTEFESQQPETSETSAQLSSEIDSSKGKNQISPSSKPEPRRKSNQQDRPLPPWKRGGERPKPKPDQNIEIVAPQSMSAESPATPGQLDRIQMGGGGFEKTKSTFQGERGGDAEDADLLAELRAISQNSGAANRFQIDDEEQEDAGSFHQQAKESDQVPQFTSPRKPSPPKPEDGPLVKEKSKSHKTDKHGMNVVVSSHSEDHKNISVLSEPSPFTDGGGFQKTSLPKTFQGDRGGAAEDANLLAELRAISAQSSSANRFSETENDEPANKDGIDNNTDQVQHAVSKPGNAALPPWKRKNAQPNSEDADDGVAEGSDKALPPWKRKGAQGKKMSPKPDVDIVVAEPQGRSKLNESGTDAAVPPWKRKAKKQASSSSDVDLLVSEAPPDQPMDGFQKSTMPKTFNRDRGGSAEDEELLAELRAISSSSGAANRFTSNDDDDVRAAFTGNPIEPSQSGEPDLEPTTESSQPLPPWKRKNGTTKPASDTLAKGGDTQEGGFEKSKMPKTFQGDRGGNAEDEDLLAELRAISSKSGAVDRFVESDNNDGEENPVQEKTKSKQPNQAMIPPWKRKSASALNANAPSRPPQSVLEAASAPTVAESDPPPQTGGFQKSTLPNTFKGERGGDAEDADLLAELRAISNNAGGANRFAEQDDDPINHDNKEPAAPSGNSFDTSKSRLQKENELPPWKKRGNAKSAKQTNSSSVDIVVEAPPTQPETGGFQKDSTPSAFKGERGGAAEDAGLLAELMAISASSGGVNRFAEDGTEDGMDTKNTFQKPQKPNKPANWKEGEKSKGKEQLDESVPQRAPDLGRFQKRMLTNTFKRERGGAAEDADLLAELQAISSSAGGSNRFAEEVEEDNQNQQKNGALPPWKQKKKLARSSTSESSEMQGQESQFGGFQKSSLPNTFKGERGGAAEDDALLAELKAISAGAGGVSRFAETDETDNPPPDVTIAPVKPLARRAKVPSKPATPSSSGPRLVETAVEPAVGSTETSMTLEDVPSALSEKNWKARKEAYIFLQNELSSRVSDKDASGDFDANSVIQGLDSLVPGMLADSNAGALDAALQFSLLYADHCLGATMAGQAEEMLSALVNGGALSSSRPSTVKSTTDLVLKLIEVGEDGSSSAHAVADVLLRQGLTSKKPKVVITSSGLILLAATSFGAACLPIASISSSAPKLLSHSNAKVRDNGMKIIAEIARALGSTSHIQGILDGMKKSQTDQLNKMIHDQPEPTPATLSFRSRQGKGVSASPEEALAALAEGNKELEAKRFAARPSVNLPVEIAKTDYSTKITQAKWSEKVAGLDKILECAGEKPYKLMEPSASVNYGPLISEMKKLLGNTHFAVCGKSMQVLAMLAEGVGEKLFPHLRPLFGDLLALTKDKKLTKFVSPCLDSFFGRVLSFDHILETDALPEALEERKQKNALARTCALDFLGRCVSRGNSAGPRGDLSEKSAKKAANLAVSKLEDSDAGVRKAALAVLQNLQAVEDEGVSTVVLEVIDGLKKTNARAHKTLSRTMKPSLAAKDTKKSEEKKKTIKQSTPRGPCGPTQAARKMHSAPASEKPRNDAATTRKGTQSVSNSQDTETNAAAHPSLDDAINSLSQLDIPNFECEAEDGGVLAGLTSTKWSHRQNAIRSFASFLETWESGRAAVAMEETSSACLVAVKENTRGFKETNVNVTKAIIEFFIVICDLHKKHEQPLMQWAASDMVTLSVDKIADRKLSQIAKGLLSSICVVCRPQEVLGLLSSKVESVKSPVPHEECQNWFNKSFCNEFGATSLGSGVTDVSQWLLKESEISNIKVKKATFASIGIMHVQLGPAFKALMMSQCQQESMREQLEKTFDAHPHDPSSASAEWPKVSIARRLKSSGSGTNNNEEDSNNGEAMSFAIEIPRMDLIASISGDCAFRMGSKDGKTAWKQRKAAVDEVEAALKKCSSLIDTSPQALRPLVELMRALRDRLSDSQGNLKPLSARVIGSLLSVTDADAQVKLGKIVHPPLVNAAMTDIKKPMRDASLEALRLSTTIPTIGGGGVNKEALEPFINAFANELNDAALKSVGLPDVLKMILSFAEHLPNLDEITVARGQSLGEKAAQAFVQCLTSSKSETRSQAEQVLTVCVNNRSLSIESLKSCTGRMKPAQQRTIAPIMSKLAKCVAPVSIVQAEGEVTVEPAMMNDHSSHRSAVKRTERNGPATPKGHGRATLNRKSMGHKPPHSPRNEVPLHPLVGSSTHNGLERSRGALRSMTWPEYPEEPHGSDVYNQLKKAWSPVLPQPTAAAFFPAGGIRKQDDGKDGCQLLSKAVLMEQAGEGVAIEEQLDLIFRWLVLVLCSKEHTVGLQALLTVMNQLFVYLHEIKYELSDSEASLLIPFVLEKASLAKGRFREVYDDLIVVLKAEDVLPAKRLGSVVCVAMIERASHAKARVAACQDCSNCIEKLGLSGIGKKGVLVVAKALSDETLSENRSALLDLMELIVERMNGDIQRLARICGANLSPKARKLVDERCQSPKQNSARHLEDPSLRRTKIPTPKKASSPSERNSFNRSQMPTASTATARPTSRTSILQDELPALDLRHSLAGSHVTTRLPKDTISTAEKPLSSGFDGSSESLGFNVGKLLNEENEPDLIKLSSGDVVLKASPKPTVAAASGHQQSSSAAALRARLMKIREKNKNPDLPVNVVSDKVAQVQMRKPDEKPSLSQVPTSFNREVEAPAVETYEPCSEFTSGMTLINDLLRRKTPLPEGDRDLDEGIECMKKFHAALSKQQNAVVAIGGDQLTALRRSIAANVNEMIQKLSLLIRYSLVCEMPTRNAGISVSLLSVSLATLMALFRDPDLKQKVSKERLKELIRETATALLDSRLVVSNESSSLDEASSTQVVRAVNKLAVQASTGGSREASLGALLSLHRELALENSSLNARLSRVVAKLFARVIKAEEALPAPWKLVDMGRVAVELDDHFDACNEKEKSVGPDDLEGLKLSKSMAKSLVESLVKNKEIVASIRKEMVNTGLDRVTSSIGRVLNEFVPMNDKNLNEPSRPQTPSKGVATLVSSLGNAKSEHERQAALMNLRQYTSEHGDEDLNAHLEQVSEAFRKFINDQLSETQNDVGSPDKEGESAANNMQERLRSLRSRLQSAEAGTAREHTVPTASASIGPARSVDSMSVSSGGESHGTLSLIKERLAAVQASRKQQAGFVPETTTSTSRAAALRARLQAVKQQNSS